MRLSLSGSSSLVSVCLKVLLTKENLTSVATAAKTASRDCCLPGLLADEADDADMSPKAAYCRSKRRTGMESGCRKEQISRIRTAVGLSVLRRSNETCH